MRIFRILKLTQFNKEAILLMMALRSSLYKITFFFTIVTAIVILMGTLMYVIEGGEHGFNNFPQSIYWAFITLTTVGYGDIVPTTFWGKFLASFIMITGYAIIAVPTGIVTVELSKASKKISNSVQCQFCNQCGEKI